MARERIGLRVDRGNVELVPEAARSAPSAASSREDSGRVTKIRNRTGDSPTRDDQTVIGVGKSPFDGPGVFDLSARERGLNERGQGRDVQDQELGTSLPMTFHESMVGIRHKGVERHRSPFALAAERLRPMQEPAGKNVEIADPRLETDD